MDVVRPSTGLSLEPVGPDDTLARHLLICAGCGRQTDTVPCSHCARNPLLEGRYRLEAKLPHGTEGLIYEAVDLRKAGQKVHIRVLPLRSDVVDRVRGLTPRWLDALRSVHHPALRGWTNAFVLGRGTSAALGVVQPRVTEPKLSERLQGPLDAARTAALLEHLLEGIAFLHGLAMSMSCGPLAPDRLSLSAQGVPTILHPGGLEHFTDPPFPPAAEPPELRTHPWAPTADLFRVGTLGACLLSGRSPVEVVATDDWSRDVQGARPLVEVLRVWMQPDPAHRPARADAALQTLRGLRRPDAPTPAAGRLPDRRADFPPGVAAVRIPASGPRTASPPASKRPDSAASSRRRVAATASSAGPVDAGQAGSTLRVLATVILLVMVLVGLFTAQITLTSTGVIDGDPWIPVGTSAGRSP